MTKKEKTAALSILMNVVLTVLKFVGFFFTGSIAVLAEAWHSSSDIITSILVFLSIKEKPIPLLKKMNGKGNGIFHPEYIISLAIGLLLFLVSIGLIFKAISNRAEAIKNPVVVGLCFIVFGILSYVVYRYETAVGKKENSVGLIADGMHSKADMLNSLLIGFSLFAYKMGLNLDVIVAFVIALFILSFSAETIINTLIAYKHKEHEYSLKYKTVSVFTLLVEEKLWSSFFGYIKKIFKDKVELTPVALKIIKGFHCILRFSVVFSFFVVIIAYATTCFYTIGPAEQGIVERFGKAVNDEPMMPGIHVKYPWPIDKVVKTNSKIIHAKSVGNITDKNNYALLWTKEHGAETPFISGDNNFFYPYLIIHYRVKDVFDFRYNHVDTDMLLDHISSRVISNIFAKKSFYQIVTSYRKAFEQDAANIIQDQLDSVNSGIEIVNVNMKDIHPPIFISSSFEEVIASYQKKEQLINEALSYKNKSIPEAKSQSQRIVKEAESYVVNSTAKAAGETERFLMQLEGFQRSDGMIRKKMYYDFIKTAYSQNNKIIVDPDSGVPEVFFSAERLMRIY